MPLINELARKLDQIGPIITVYYWLNQTLSSEDDYAIYDQRKNGSDHAKTVGSGHACAPSNVAGGAINYACTHDVVSFPDPRERDYGPWEGLVKLSVLRVLCSLIVEINCK